MTRCPLGARMMAPQALTDRVLNARIAARRAEFKANAALAQARGTFAKTRRTILGPIQQRALIALRAEALTPRGIADAIRWHDHQALVVTLAGLAERGFIEPIGDAWRLTKQAAAA